MTTSISSRLDRTAVSDLKRSFQGELLLPDNEAYDTARRVYNLAIDRHPALIARPANAEDIRRAICFAREHRLPFAVKGGGHSISGSAVCDDGLMLDLSSLKRIVVDAPRRTAVAQPGLLIGEVDRATQAEGLATPLGTVSHTGIAGITLGGGIGWLNGEYGLACDNLVSANVVTADGDLLRANQDENPDLFWGIRGGGGNFGVVASFTYKLYPIQSVLAGSLVFPAERSREILRRYHEFAAGCPDRLSTTFNFGLDDQGRTTAAISVCWCGTPADGERALRPLRAFGRPAEDTIGVMDYRALQTSLDEKYPHGRRHYWKASWLRDLGDEAIDTMLAYAATRPVGPSSRVIIALQHVHGAAARVDPAATAFPHRRDQYDMLFLSQWTDPVDAERHITWTRAFFEAMKPLAEPSVYVNSLGAEDAGRIRDAYGTNYPRLASLKARYDPTNFFRANHNILPDEACKREVAPVQSITGR